MNKAIAKLSHYVCGNYYIVELTDVVYQFLIATVEEKVLILTSDIEPSDLGTTTFESEMKGSDLNRWIAKAV